MDDTRNAIEPYDQIRQAEHVSAEQARRDLEGKSLDQIVLEARKYESDYRGVLDQGFQQEGWISATYFRDMLDRAYPDANSDKKSQFASQLADRIRESFGPTQSSVKQSTVMAANSRYETALSEMAKRLKETDISRLEQQARDRIPAHHFPENFDDFKAEWIAEWIAKGHLLLPTEGGQNSVTA